MDGTRDARGKGLPRGTRGLPRAGARGQTEAWAEEYGSLTERAPRCPRLRISGLFIDNF